MAQKETQSERPEKSMPSSLVPPELAEMGKKRIDDFLAFQTEVLDKLRETNQHWFERALSEANLASEFAAKMTAARSIPDAMSVYQEWSGRRFEMMAQDGKNFLIDAQNLMQTGAKLLSNGWASKRGSKG